MKTINRILQDNGFTRVEIAVYRKMGVCNGAGGKGGIKFTKELAKLPGFKKKKGKQLLIDIDLISDCHDIRFHLGGGLFDFLRANWNFSYNMIRLFHWTTPMSRFLLFTTLFLGTTLVGWKYFTWTKIL